MGLSNDIWVIEEQPSDGKYQFDVTFPYLSKGHVYAYVGEDGPLRDFFWVNENRIELVLFDDETEIPTGSHVYIVRRTPINDSLVTYQGGQLLSGEDLNKSYMHILYILQEIHDGISLTGLNYRPINSDLETTLALLEGNITESLLYQGLTEKIDLIDQIQMDQEGLSGQVTVVQQDIDTLNGELTTLVGRVNTEENKSVAIEEKLWAGTDGTGTEENPDEGSLLGQYTLRIVQDIDGNRRVAGIGLSMGEETPSEMVVMVDKFMIVDPANTNAEGATPVFTVGNVDGVPQVGIRGELLVDGSVKADSIQVGEITLGHLTTTAQGSVDNSQQNWDQISNLPDYQIVDSKTMIDSGAILLANGVSTLDELNADHIVETTGRKWFSDDADITHARANGLTLIQGGYLHTDLINVSAITIGNLDGAGFFLKDSLEASVTTINSGGLKMENGVGDYVEMTPGVFSMVPAGTGGRMQITNDNIKVYDSNNQLRVQIGKLS
jgi:hypothetical protein